MGRPDITACRAFQRAAPSAAVPTVPAMGGSRAPGAVLASSPASPVAVEDARVLMGCFLTQDPIGPGFRLPARSHRIRSVDVHWNR